MKAIFDTFAELKLEQPRHRARFFNYMTSTNVFAYNEASFFLCARDYIYNPSDQKIQAFPRVFLQVGSTLQVNISGSHSGIANKFFADNQVSIHSAGGKVSRTVSTFRNGKTPGMQFGGAGNYNLMTQALDYISRWMSRDQTNYAIQAIRADGSLPVVTPDAGYLKDVVDELKGNWCADPLRELV